MTRIRVNRIYLYFQYPLLPPGVLTFRRDLPATCNNFRKPIFPIPPTPLASLPLASLSLFFFAFLPPPPFIISRARCGEGDKGNPARERGGGKVERREGRKRGRDSDPPAAGFRLPIVVDGGSSVIVSIVLETTLSPNPLSNVPKKVNAARSPAPSRPGPTTPGFDPLLSSRWTKNKNS